MATSTASSPSFLAGLIGAPSSSRLVWESSGLAVLRSLMVAASRCSTSLLISWLIHCPDRTGNRYVSVIPPNVRHLPVCEAGGLWIEADRKPSACHIAFGLSDRVLAIVEDRGGKHGAGVALPHAFDQVIERADAPARDHRNRHGVGNGAGQLEVEAHPRAVAVHRG